MALIVGLICVIVFLFFVHKDILLLANELTTLKKQVQNSQQRVSNKVQMVGQTCEPIQFKTYSTNGMDNKQGTHTQVSAATETIANNDDKSDTYSEVDSEKKSVKFLTRQNDTE